MAQAKKGIDIPGLVDAYYEDGPSKGFSKGQIVWIPAFYPNRDNIVIDMDVASDPSETHIPAFLRPLSQKRNFFPVKSMNLGSQEHAFVVKGKVRPAIIVLNNIARWAKSPSENILLCVPLFRVYKPKFTQSFVLKTQAFQYPDKFYMPPDSKYGFEEAVARLELIQSVHQLTVEPFPNDKISMAMTEDFFSLFSLQLLRFQSQAPSQNEILETYGQLIIEEAKKQGVDL